MRHGLKKLDSLLSNLYDPTFGRRDEEWLDDAHVKRKHLDRGVCKRVAMKLGCQPDNDFKSFVLGVI